MARRKKQDSPECDWLEDSSGEFWETRCGEAHCFITDGPRENRYAFCPYCGRKLTARLAKGER